MHYYFGTYSNGYCGCNEEYLLCGNEDELEMEKIFEDSMDTMYPFADFDEMFSDIYREDYNSDEEYDEAWAEAEIEYRDQCLGNSTLREITKEEYENYKSECYPILYEGER